jgi:DNA-binding NtrC family response regulator
LSTRAVLVVDDEQLIRWSIRSHLEHIGFQVVVAENGEQAMACFRDEVGLVLLDLRLRDTNGLAVLRQIKKKRPDCPVILMTAFGTPEVAREAVADGAFRVVDKPFNLDDMTSLVEQAFCSAG